MKRIQFEQIKKDLARKMVFLVGPRQVGKTTLAKQIASTYKNPLYLNYDYISHKKLILEEAWPEYTDLLIFDEIHKMDQWKNFVKGIYDTKPAYLHILVTGSARLETFEKTGESLAGRYYLHRLMPFTPSELHRLKIEFIFNDLLLKGGFPEPYLLSESVEINRWREQYTNGLLSTDIFDVENIQNMKAFRLVFELLKTKVGSPVSYQSLSEDIGISPNTVKRYIELLEALYVVFRVTPFSNNIARSLLKEPKIYFFDNGLIDDRGARLENFVAICLLKYTYEKIDCLGEKYSLHYLRTKEGLEVDFAISKNKKIEQIIEVKNADKELSKSLVNFHLKYDFPAVQLVGELKQERKVNHIHIIKAERFLLEY